jgi:curved DNA-binding protein CbpA
MCSASPSQNLAESLTKFVCDDSPIACILSRANEIERNLSPLTNTFEMSGFDFETSLAKNDGEEDIDEGSSFTQYLQLIGEKVFWKGTLEMLKEFVFIRLTNKGKWISPGGGAMRFKSTDGSFEMNWYAKQQTLTFAGKEGPVVKEKLVSMLTQSAKQATRENIVSEQSPSETDRLGSLINIVDTLKEKFEYFEHEFETFKIDTKNDIKVLNDKGESNTSKEKDSEIHRLQDENHKLHTENADLIKRLNEHTQILSDTTKKLKAVEDEKASLLTVIHLLRTENNGDATDLSEGQNTSWKRRSYTRGINSKPPAKPIITNTDNLGKNQFAPLTIEDSAEDEDNELQSKGPITNTVEEKNKTTKPNQSTDRTSKSTSSKQKKSDDLNANRPNQKKSGKKKTVVVAGDSIVKDLIGGKMSKDDPNHFYVVKPFPGATLEDMKDFIKPLTRKKPDKLILHVGTNNLKHNPPSEIAESIADLVTNIRTESPDTKVGISSLLVRNDTNLVVKVNEVNDILRGLCNQSKIPFLDNSNITFAHLNLRGLHLNKVGSVTLQSNFKDFANKFN